MDTINCSRSHMEIPTSTLLLGSRSYQKFIEAIVSNDIPRPIAIGMACVIGNRILRMESVSRLLGKDQGDGDAKFIGDLTTAPECRLSYSSLIKMPQKIRKKIFRKLKAADLCSLRMVCSQIKTEVDQRIGLRVVVDTRELEAYKWIQSVVVQDCIIKYLDDHSNWKFVMQPVSLKKISFAKEFPISSEIISTLLNEFQSLEEFSFDLEAPGGVGDGFSCEEISKIMKLILDNFAERLHVEFSAHDWILHWKVALHQAHFYDAATQFPQTGLKLTVPSDGLREVYLKIPMISEKHRDLWISFLNQLPDLESLYFNLGECDWTVFPSIFEKNFKTLKSISLSHVRAKNSPLDWKMFKKCSNLRSLDVACNMRVVPYEFLGMSTCIKSINLDMLPTSNLEVLLLSFVSFDEEQFKRMLRPYWIPKIVNGQLIRCEIDNVPTCVPVLYLVEPVIDYEKCAGDCLYYPVVEMDSTHTLGRKAMHYFAEKLVDNLDVVPAVLLTCYLMFMKSKSK